jgi:hypothetical protein
LYKYGVLQLIKIDQLFVKFNYLPTLQKKKKKKKKKKKHLVYINNLKPNIFLKVPLWKWQKPWLLWAYDFLLYPVSEANFKTCPTVVVKMPPVQ